MHLSKINIKGRFPFIRLRQFIENPRSFYNWLAKNLYYRYQGDKYHKYYFDLNCLSPSETLNYLIETGASLARFNDGEFEQLLGYGIYPPDSDWEQKNSKKLVDDMRLVLSSKDSRILIAITPCWYFLSRDGDSLNEPFFESMWFHTRAILYKYLIREKMYGDCRLFVPSVSKDLDWSVLRDFLKTKNVVIVTGGVSTLKNVNLGIKNYYIECGKINAYEKLDTIIENVRVCFENNKLNKNNTIILASLGPTAGILAYRLLDEATVWDTGHIFKYALSEL